jgi:hypothetical protein
VGYTTGLKEGKERRKARPEIKSIVISPPLPTYGTARRWNPKKKKKKCNSNSNNIHSVEEKGEESEKNIGKEPRKIGKTQEENDNGKLGNQGTK